MDYLTLVSGVVAFLGFVIQVRDLFPEHREQRKTLALLSAGIFLGLLIGLFSKTSEIRFEFHLFPLLMAIFTVACFVYTLWVAVRYADLSLIEEQRHLGRILNNSLGCFILCLVILALSFWLTGNGIG